MTAAHRGQDDERLYHILKALGNPVRLQIVRFVQQHPWCIANQILLQLPDDVARAQSTLSQHLKILRAAGLIKAKCDGAAMSYVIDEESLDWLRTQLANM